MSGERVKAVRGTGIADDPRSAPDGLSREAEIGPSNGTSGVETVGLNPVEEQDLAGDQTPASPSRRSAISSWSGRSASTS